MNIGFKPLESRMAEVQRFVGDSTVVESGTVLLGRDDSAFTIDVAGLRFVIRVVVDIRAAMVDPKRTSKSTMEIGQHRKSISDNI
jgi:dihydroorotase-like cyclic amidohydrolase